MVHVGSIGTIVLEAEPLQQVATADDCCTTSGAKGMVVAVVQMTEVVELRVRTRRAGLDIQGGIDTRRAIVVQYRPAHVAVRTTATSACIVRLAAVVVVCASSDANT